MRKHTVYITINDINNKFYIGTHLTNNSLDSYLGSGNLLLMAIKKYGKENFKKTILGEFENHREAHYWEEFYIKLFQATSREIAYNISPSGGTKYGGALSEYTKNKISKNSKGKIPWNKGLKTGPRKEETKKSIRETLEGVKHTTERRNNISKGLIGNTPWNKGIKSGV